MMIPCRGGSGSCARQEVERDDGIDDAIAGPSGEGGACGIGQHDVLAPQSGLEAGGLGGARDAGRALRIRAWAGRHRNRPNLSAIAISSRPLYTTSKNNTGRDRQPLWQSSRVPASALHRVLFPRSVTRPGTLLLKRDSRAARDAVGALAWGVVLASAVLAVYSVATCRRWAGAHRRLRGVRDGYVFALTSAMPRAISVYPVSARQRGAGGRAAGHPRAR